MRSIAVIFACSAIAIAAPAHIPAASSPALDAREIVKRSIEAENRSAKAQLGYTFIQSDVEKHLDAGCHVKSTDTNISKIAIIDGTRFEERIEHNGQPVSRAEARKQKEKLLKLVSETPDERARRLRQIESEREFMNEIPDAFEIKLAGEENIQGRPAWVLEATPRPGYQARNKRARMFAGVRGKFWVDRQDFNWAKIEARVTDALALGPMGVARVQEGSRITYEQTRVDEGVWFPKLIRVTADAKILFFKNYNLDETISFRDFRRAELTARR